MSNHTEVTLEVVGAAALTFAISFAAVYFCLCRFITDTGVTP